MPRKPVVLPTHPRYVYVARVGSLDAGAVCGTILNPPGCRYGPLNQLVYQLVLVETGEMLVVVDQEPPVRAAEGEVVLLNPGQLVRLQCTPARETRHSWMSVRAPLLPPERTVLLRAAPRTLPRSPAIGQLLEAGLALAESLEGESLHTALQGVVTAALSLYLEEARTQGQIDRWAVQHPAVAAARRLVRQRLHEPLTVATLAQSAHVTPDYLTRLFRQELGTTPMRYVWAERVRLGVDLLEHTGLPVAEVAARSGFQTANHFARLVRAATGRSPRHVRRLRWRHTEQPGRTPLT
jgi:AraC-like DNA-binding protein